MRTFSHFTAAPARRLICGGILLAAFAATAARARARGAKILAEIAGYGSTCEAYHRVAAALFTLEESVVPPTLNLDFPDPDCDLDYTPNRSVRREVDHVLCNTIAFGSKNSALLVRRAS